MKKFFHLERGCLAYIKQDASADYWDRQWKDETKHNKHASKGSKRAWVVEITRKFLKPEDGLLIEGGCGLGDKVDSFVRAGYKCIGIDFATETVSLINKENPLLDVRYGDVRKLEFPDSTFVGYWSLGVIEHFWNGYADIANEMHRVLKPGGFLFLTFPFMNTYRKETAKGRYPELASSDEVPGFYQCALDSIGVQQVFESLGFELVHKHGFSVLNGLKDEKPEMGKQIDFILKIRKMNVVTKALYLFVNKALDFTLGNRYGHSVLMVMRKKS
jgi:SAM-dependent methyltransferase